MNFLYRRLSWRFCLTLCFALFMGSALGACQALDSTSPVAVPNQIPVAAPSGLPGGAVDQSLEGPLAQSMKANAQNLLNQKYPESGIQLETLHGFSSQVVAGINYRLAVSYTDQSAASGKLMLTVYKDLEGRYTLSQDNYPG